MRVSATPPAQIPRSRSGRQRSLHAVLERGQPAEKPETDTREPRPESRDPRPKPRQPTTDYRQPGPGTRDPAPPPARPLARLRRQLQAIEIVQLPDVDADSAVVVGEVEGAPEPRPPDHLVGLVRRAGVDGLGERLVEAVAENQELDVTPLQRFAGHAPERAVLVDGVNDRPGQGEER